MIRQAIVLSWAAAMCTWVAAQPSRAGLTASQQQQLFLKNRAMITSLVDSSLDISNSSGDFTQRARSYRQVVSQFQKELDRAAGDGDPGRVAELGKHLDMVLRQGLTPSLRGADQQIGSGTGRQDLLDIRDGTIELVEWLQFRAHKDWSDIPEVRDVVNALQKTKKELADSVGPAMHSQPSSR